MQKIDCRDTAPACQMRMFEFGKKKGVSKTFWTRSKDGAIKAPLSKGAANKLL